MDTAYYNSNTIDLIYSRDTVVTGDRPTGKLHLGHYVGSLQNRLKLQHVYDQYILIADVQALTDNYIVDKSRKIQRNIYEVVKDYISVGIDPDKNVIALQSAISELAEITIYFLNIVTINRLARNPTVKTELLQKDFEEIGSLNSEICDVIDSDPFSEINYSVENELKRESRNNLAKELGDAVVPAGFFCYPISQAADIIGLGGTIIPVGEDQLPMIEQTNEIIRKFNYLYRSHRNNEIKKDMGSNISNEFIRECKPYMSEIKRLVGIDGRLKAGKSLNNAIFLSDSPDEIKQKVFQMFTDPNHIKVSDPGKVEGNAVFSYLDAFMDNKEELESLKNHYRRGGLGDVTIKSILNEILQKFLTPIREKREGISDEYIYEIIRKGTERARLRAKNILLFIKDSIGIKFF